MRVSGVLLTNASLRFYRPVLQPAICKWTCSNHQPSTINHQPTPEQRQHTNMELPTPNCHTAIWPSASTSTTHNGTHIIPGTGQRRTKSEAQQPATSHMYATSWQGHSSPKSPDHQRMNTSIACVAGWPAGRLTGSLDSSPFDSMSRLCRPFQKGLADPMLRKSASGNAREGRGLPSTGCGNAVLSLWKVSSCPVRKDLATLTGT